MSRVAVLIACACSTAIASPRSDPTTGRAVFTGATMSSATSIDLNPAAIGPGTQTYLYIAAATVIDHYGIRLDQQNLDGSITQGSHLDDYEIGPGGNAAIVLHVNDRATLGAEFRSAPGETFIANRTDLAFHTLGGGQRTYTLGVAASLRITNDIYFGVSLDAGPTYLHLHYARDSALENGHGARGVDSDCGQGTPCGIANPQAEEHYDVNVGTRIFTTANLVLNAGLLIQVAHDVWFGIAFHAPPGLDVQTDLQGTMDVRLAPRDGGALLHGGADVFISQPSSADAELRARLPASLDLHVGARWEDLSRLQAYDVRGYGATLLTAGIPEWQLRVRGFHDPLAMWAGVEQVELRRGSDWLRVGARIGFETSSVRNSETTPITIAPFSYTADVGAQLRVGAFILQATYGVQYFPTVNVSDSAFDPRNRVSCIDSGYDYATPACTATRNGYGIPSADGQYDRLEHAIRVGLTFQFE
ncbi:MAG: hypothetical protein QM831_46245 [Kofleriaceae bacterium]